MARSRKKLHNVVTPEELQSCIQEFVSQEWAKFGGQTVENVDCDYIRGFMSGYEVSLKQFVKWALETDLIRIPEPIAA